MDRSYAHVLEAALRQPWAVRPDVLPVIAEILAARISGRGFSDEEIAARVGAAPPSRPTRTVGAVAILPLQGVLMPKASIMTEMSGGTSLAWFRAAFREAMASMQVSAIVIDIDSPGGLVDQVPETAGEIRQARGSKPIIAVANTEAASAAYWIGAQADELVVTPSGMAGSVGVWSLHTDLSRALDMAGITHTFVSAGKYKVEANPYEPLGAEAREAIQSRIDEYYRLFTQDVSKGRGVPVKAVLTGYGQGRFLTATQALAEGMVDRIETFESVLKRLGVRRVGTSASAADESNSHPSPPGISVVDPKQEPRATPIAAAPVAPHDTEVVDEPWDGGAEEAALSNDAGEATYRRMYAWEDPERDADTKAAWKFPHHKVTDGSPGPANVNGVRAALSRLPQSDIPEADRPGVERHLQTHLDRFNEQREANGRASARARLLRLHGSTVTRRAT